MNKKTIGILVCTLLIAAAVLPAAGIMTFRNTKRVERSLNTDKVIKQNIEDKVIINEKEDPTPQPITKYSWVSVPAAAFVPEDKDTIYRNKGYFLYGDGYFFAPINFPHEATVMMLKFFWEDKSTYFDAELYLWRTPGLMAYVTTNGGSGSGSSVDNTIDHPDIDNEKYSYYLMYYSETIDIEFKEVMILYSYEVPDISDDISETQQTQVSQDLITH